MLNNSSNLKDIINIIKKIAGNGTAGEVTGPPDSTTGGSGSTTSTPAGNVSLPPKPRDKRNISSVSQYLRVKNSVKDMQNQISKLQNFVLSNNKFINFITTQYKLSNFKYLDKYTLIKLDGIWGKTTQLFLMDISYLSAVFIELSSDFYSRIPKNTSPKQIFNAYDSNHLRTSIPSNKDFIRIKTQDKIDKANALTILISKLYQNLFNFNRWIQNSPVYKHYETQGKVLFSHKAKPLIPDINRLFIENIKIYEWNISRLYLTSISNNENFNKFLKNILKFSDEDIKNIEKRKEVLQEIIKQLKSRLESADRVYTSTV